MSDFAPRRSILGTLSSALLALFVAVLVWIIATNGELTRISRFPPLATAGIPIELQNLADGLMVVEGENQSVRVDLLIPAERASDLRASDLRALADLSGLGPGTHQVEVEVLPRAAAPPFRLLNSTPNRILVIVEEVVSADIPLSVLVADPETIPQSFQILPATSSTESIHVIGPKSEVDQIDHAEIRLNVRGARAPVSDTLAPILVSRDGRVLSRDNVQMDPTSVEVTVPIEQRQGYRELVVRPVLSGSPAANFQPGSFTYEPQTVTVVGQPSLVNGLNGIVDTEPISIEGLTEGQYTRYVPVVLPESVSPLEQGIVTVRITIEPRTGTRSITVTPSVTGLAPGLGVAPSGIVPATVDIFLKGPLVELDALEEGDVVVQLEVTERAAGTYLLEPRVVAPGTLTAESVIPQQVEVTLVELEGSRDITVGLRAVGMADGLIAAFDPPTATATLTGGTVALASVDPDAMTALVQAAGLSAGTHELTPYLELPGLQVAPMPAVDVTLADRALLQSIVVPVTTDLPESDTATASELTVTPVTVRVSYLAPPDAPPLTEGDARATLAIATREAGAYLLRPSVRLPPGYLFIGIVPLRIRVLIR